MQGSSLDTVENLPISDAKNIWIMMSTGIEGPYKDYLIAFATTPQDKKQRKEFSKLFPEPYKFMTLHGASRGKTKHEVAKQAAAALISSDAPAWLQEAIKEK